MTGLFQLLAILAAIHTLGCGPAQTSEVNNSMSQSPDHGALSPPVTASSREFLWESSLRRDHPLVGRIWSTDRSDWVDPIDVEEDLAGVRFVLLGETHDNVDHHRLQARLVTAVGRRGRRVALALEMIDADRQPAIDALESPDPEGLARAVGWGEGWGHFEWYRMILAAALDEEFAIIAANYPLAQARALVRGGLDALNESEVNLLRLDRPLPPEQHDDLIEELREAHCGHPLPPAMAEGMVLAQRARDAMMATRMLAGSDADGALLIAGTGHVRRDRGVPSELVRREVAPEAIRTVAFHEVAAEEITPEAFATQATQAPPPYHYLWFTPAAVREDPCEAFRRHMHRRSPSDE